MAYYPRFSDEEMQRRRRLLDAAMAKRGVAHVLLYGANRLGSAIGWLTRWPVTREAVVVHTPGERDLLLVNFYNHVPNAERIATEAEVRWAGEDPIATAIGELRRRRAPGSQSGTIGALSLRAHAALAALADPIDMTPDYTRLRLVKSAEEIEWVRVAAGMTDAAVRELHADARPGVSEVELADAAFDAIVSRLRPGAMASQLVDAGGLVEDAGFTIRDDLVHGFVGGYLPPVLGTTARALAPIPEFTIASGMMLVVQPNVGTADESAGVQTGELVLVTNRAPSVCTPTTAVCSGRRVAKRRACSSGSRRSRSPLPRRRRRRRTRPTARACSDRG